MLTDGFVTDFIHMEKGVLQGDCFSPLMFNLIINTFIHSVKHEQYEQFGYKFMRYLTPRHWYQFADDAAVISGLESSNQILLNLFSRWCLWADMIIGVDKCHLFGIKKSGTSSKQFQPKLFVNNELIPPLKQDELFTCLGRHFDYEMTSNQHKDDLLPDTKNIMKKKIYIYIYDLSLHPKKYDANLSWNLTIADIIYYLG